MSKTAFVTGTSSGIGAEIGRRLISDGYFVAGMDLNEGASGSNSSLFKGDVTDPAAVKAAIAEVVGARGQIDAVVPCAGIAMRGLLIDQPGRVTSLGNPIPMLTYEQTRKIIDVNVHGSFNVCREAVPHIRKGGSIVLFSSILSTRPTVGLWAYCASKGAIDSLALALAVELAPDIRVNAVQPGLADTAVWTNAGLSEADWVRMKDMLKGATLLQRIGEPKDLADAVAWLVSDQAAWVTGVLLPVNGGGHLK